MATPAALDVGFSPVDEQAMRQAIDQARNAGLVGEVPVGAVIVREDAQGRSQVIATGYNRPITTHDPTAHAELVALRAAAHLVGNYRLPDCTLYVTLEPCAMCAMALMHARFRRVVFGAFDPKTGAAGSVVDLFGVARLNHQTAIEGGCLEADCGRLLREFFAERRAQRRAEQVERRAAAGGLLPGDARAATPAAAWGERATDLAASGPGTVDAGTASASVPAADASSRLRIDVAVSDADPDPETDNADDDAEVGLDLLDPIPVGQVEEIEVLPVGFAIEIDMDFSPPDPAVQATAPSLSDPPPPRTP